MKQMFQFHNKQHILNNVSKKSYLSVVSLCFFFPGFFHVLRNNFMLRTASYVLKVKFVYIYNRHSNVISSFSQCLQCTCVAFREWVVLRDRLYLYMWTVNFVTDTNVPVHKISETVFIVFDGNLLILKYNVSRFLDSHASFLWTAEHSSLENAAGKKIHPYIKTASFRNFSYTKL
jgi:hypothetical protein